MLNMPYFERHAPDTCIRLGASLGNHRLIDFHFMIVSLGEREKRKYDPG